MTSECWLFQGPEDGKQQSINEHSREYVRLAEVRPVHVRIAVREKVLNLGDVCARSMMHEPEFHLGPHWRITVIKLPTLWQQRR